MNPHVRLSGLLAFLLLVPALAESQSVAYISSEEIFKRLPQAMEARGRLGEMQAKWMNQIRTLEQKSAALRVEIERNRLLWGAQERERKEGELRNVDAELQQVRSDKFGPNGEFEQLYQELMAPVIELVMIAVRAEAEEQEYDFVLDKSTRGLPILFANPDHDLTYRVLVRLGVEVDPAELQKKEEEGLQLLPESLPINISNDGGTSAPRREEIRNEPPQEQPREASEVEEPNRLLENEEDPE